MCVVPDKISTSPPSLGTFTKLNPFKWIRKIAFTNYYYLPKYSVRSTELRHPVPI